MKDGLHWAETADEREAGFRLRYDVYVREMKRYAGAAGHDDGTFRDRPEDESGRILLAYEEGRLVGTMRVHWGSDGAFPESFRRDYGLDRLAQLVPPEKTAVLTRFAVTSELRGSLVPISMMLEAYQAALARGCELACIDCVPHLVNLYRKLGFRPYKEVVNSDDIGILVPLAMPVRDFGFLAGIESPLLGVVPAGLLEEPPPAWVHELFPPNALEDEARAKRAWASAFAIASEQSQGRHGLFDGLDAAEIEGITTDANLVTCSRGTFVVRKGSVGRNLFVVLSGALEVQDGGRTVDAVGPGDCIGEVNFLVREQRIADVVAATDDVKVLIIGERHLNRLIGEKPQVACRLLLNLSRILATRLATRAQLQSRMGRVGKDG